MVFLASQMWMILLIACSAVALLSVIGLELVVILNLHYCFCELFALLPHFKLDLLELIFRRLDPCGAELGKSHSLGHP